MRSPRSVLTMLLGVAVFAALVSTAVFSQPATSQNGYLALVGGTIYLGPTEEPMRDAVVLIQGGKIAAVGTRTAVKVSQNVQSVDCTGLTITAGFWNSHVHFFALVAPGAIPPDTIIRMLGYMTSPSPEIMDTGQATAASKKLLDAGVDGIKVHLQPPPPPNSPLPESGMQAAVSEAHRVGKPVFVHPNSGADVLAPSELALM